MKTIINKIQLSLQKKAVAGVGNFDINIKFKYTRVFWKVFDLTETKFFSLKLFLFFLLHIRLVSLYTSSSDSLISSTRPNSTSRLSLQNNCLWRWLLFFCFGVCLAWGGVYHRRLHHVDATEVIARSTKISVLLLVARSVK